jgi:tellurite resistance protein TerC
VSPQAILWVIFVVALVGMLYVDLFQSRSEKAITLREAAFRSLEWILAALLYCGAIYWLLSPAKAAEFLTGYLIEKSLSVDNLFIFIMIFSYFNVDPAHQPRVLKWGILGAVIMRFVLIFLGTILVSRFQWVFLVFGAILLYSAYKMAFSMEKEFNPNDNFLFRGLRKVLPMTGMHGNRFLAQIDGRWHATPLFLTVAVVEFSDLVFALDSIPAIFSITTDPLIVFTSNIFAILGLRALYFLVSGLVQIFKYLKFGVAFILAFVGVKMLIMHWVHISTPVSLGVVIGVLAASIAFSVFLRPREKETEEPS